MHISRYLLLFTLICCICATFFAGCTGVDKKNQVIVQQTSTGAGGVPAENSEISWMTIPFTDAVTGKQTSIAELATEGNPIILHTFAVWCPACSMQLRETGKVVQSNPDGFIVLGIDLDPRESGTMVKNHIEKNQFVGMYTAAPTTMTKSMISTFGTQIVQSLPQTIIICNKSVTYVGDGVFPEQKLKMILSEIC